MFPYELSVRHVKKIEFRNKFKKIQLKIKKTKHKYVNVRKARKEQLCSVR